MSKVTELMKKARQTLDDLNEQVALLEFRRERLSNTVDLLEQEATEVTVGFENNDNINYSGMKPYQLGLAVGLRRAKDMIEPYTKEN